MAINKKKVALREDRIHKAYQNIFIGDSALFRRQAPIQKLVEKHASTMKEILKEIDMKIIVTTLQKLLKEGRFALQNSQGETSTQTYSEPGRQIAIPAASRSESLTSAPVPADNGPSIDSNMEEDSIYDLDGSSCMSTGRPPKTPAKKNHSDHLANKARDQDGEIPMASANTSKATINSKVQVEQFELRQPEKDIGRATQPAISTPAPNLPHAAQVAVLRSMQTFLEQICYQYTSKKLPGLLRTKQWTCPESIELSEWSAIVLRYDARHFNSKSVLKTVGKPPTSIFAEVHQIRHSAVHRNRKSIYEIRHMVQSAILFCFLLQDEIALTRLQTLSSVLGASAQELKHWEVPLVEIVEQVPSEVRAEEIGNTLVAAVQWLLQFPPRPPQKILI